LLWASGERRVNRAKLSESYVPTRFIPYAVYHRRDRTPAAKPPDHFIRRLLHAGADHAVMISGRVEMTRFDT
jgi:hypothetical protein